MPVGRNSIFEPSVSDLVALLGDDIRAGAEGASDLGRMWRNDVASSPLDAARLVAGPLAGASETLARGMHPDL